MQWFELDKLLGEHRRAFPKAQDTLETWERPGCVFELLERQTSASLDAAIRTFATTLQWPPLTEDEKVMLGFRLDFAWHLVTAFCGTERGERMFPTSHASDTEQVEWVLIDAWQWPGSEFWAHQARSGLDREPDAPFGTLEDDN